MKEETERKEEGRQFVLSNVPTKTNKKKDIILFCLTSLPRDLKKKTLKKQPKWDMYGWGCKKRKEKESDTLRNLVPINKNKKRDVRMYDEKEKMMI